MRDLGVRFLLAVTLTLFAVAQQAALGTVPDPEDWMIDDTTGYPYVTIAPRTTNTNLQLFAIACEEAPNGRILQIRLYTTDDNPLQPTYPHLQPLKGDARAIITIDRRTYHVFLLFADDYAVLADALDGSIPMLSGRLIDAIQAGTEMRLLFDLLAESRGDPLRFDSEAVIDLKARHSREALIAIRRCVDPPERAHAFMHD